ncbi:MAG: hypothetical protein K9L59_16160 [Desulfobacterales bacterium]|nr:hypothetical protein [Desulfobacterales bacterium]MCF8078931.1 hypothetical protein [Desulfobacterales bacterium]
MNERDLLRVELPEERYDVDFKLFEHGHRVSNSCLTLSLAGIAVVGVFLPLIEKGPAAKALTDAPFEVLLASSTIAFALSAGVALLQQFYANSGMFHHMKAMKLAHASDPAVDDEIATRTEKFMHAHRLLKGTAGLLTLGTALLGAAFIRFMSVL